MHRTVGIGIRGVPLFTRADLLARDVTPTELSRAAAGGMFLRLQAGVYVERAAYLALRPVEQHRLAVCAAMEQTRGGSAVVSHLSASVLHDLPQYRFRDRPVDVTVAADVGATSRRGLRRHLDAIDTGDLTTVAGIACTTLDRTVFDVMRTMPLEVAVTCADAALRREAVVGRRFDPHAQEDWRERMRERAARKAGARGIRRARWVIEFADGRAELPGESVSRVQLFRLGFVEFDLQVAVPGPRGADYFVDIALPEARTFWEFDGEVKYRDPSLRGDRSIEQVLLDEKKREDWIRGRTQWRVCRGGFSDITTPEVLAARLEAFGVAPMRGGPVAPPPR